MSAFDLRTETPHRRAISLPFVDQEVVALLPRFDCGRQPPWHLVTPSSKIGVLADSELAAVTGGKLAHPARLKLLYRPKAILRKLADTHPANCTVRAEFDRRSS